MTALNEGWFTEVFQDQGTAFSLQVKRKLHEEQTPFQKLEIYETETFGNLMVLDGCVMLTTRDNFLYHEMMTHPALFTHKNPKKVVIVGGGDCGTLEEVLKHPGDEDAWQVEIDERVTRMSEKYFPELCEANSDPRVNFFFGDGIQWMREIEPASIDVLIIDSTDPVGPAEGLFALDFYRDAMPRCAMAASLFSKANRRCCIPTALSRISTPICTRPALATCRPCRSRSRFIPPAGGAALWAARITR